MYTYRHLSLKQNSIKILEAKDIRNVVNKDYFAIKKVIKARNEILMAVIAIIIERDTQESGNLRSIFFGG